MEAFQEKVDKIPPKIEIGAGETFLCSILLPNFKNLQKSAEGIRINLCNMRSSDLPSALDSGEVDLIIVSENRLGKNTKKLSLGKLEYKLYAPMNWENLSKYRSSPLEMICNEPYASLSGSGHRRTSLEDLVLKKTGKKPNYELANLHGKLVIARKQETFHYKPEIKTVAKEIQNIFKKAIVPKK